MPHSLNSHQHPTRGILLFLTAFALFSISDAASKLMGSLHVPPVQTAWLRYVVFVSIIGAVALCTSGKVPLTSRRPPLQALRAFGILGSSAFFIAGLQFLPMAEATAISFTTPLIVTALSIPLLGETVGLRRWAAVFIGLIGVLVVVRPGSGALDVYAIFPFLSSCSFATALLMTRKMSEADGPVVALLYASVIGFVVLSVLVPFNWIAPSWEVLGLGLVTGVTSTAAQFLTVLAFRHAPASTLVPFSYSQLIWSVVLGVLVFSNIPDMWTLVGAAIIIGSGLYTAHRERRLRLPPTVPAKPIP
jgi:drug/metabolite transporter (DMT)-like permease